MNNFLHLYEAGAVRRWHTWPTIRDQDNAAHSWGVAMILHQIAPFNHNVLVHALVHDLHEVDGGDTPYNVKVAYPEIKKALSKQEQDFIEGHELWTPLTQEDTHLLKWADMFELLLWCFREQDLGNRRISIVIGRAYAALDELGYPNEAAEQLFKEVHNGRK